MAHLELSEGEATLMVDLSPGLATALLFRLARAGLSLEEYLRRVVEEPHVDHAGSLAEQAKAGPPEEWPPNGLTPKNHAPAEEGTRYSVRDGSLIRGKPPGR